MADQGLEAIVVCAHHRQDLFVNILRLAIVLQVQQVFSFAQADVNVVGLQALGAIDRPQRGFKLLFVGQQPGQQPPAHAGPGCADDRSLERGPDQQVLSFITAAAASELDKRAGPAYCGRQPERRAGGMLGQIAGRLERPQRLLRTLDCGQQSAQNNPVGKGR